jgi:hypothetical protein
MGVTMAFVSALIVGLPFLVVFIVALAIWRCTVVVKRKKRRIHELRSSALQAPRAPVECALPSAMKESISESDSLEICPQVNTDAILESANTEVFVSASIKNQGLMYSTIKVRERHPRPHHEGITMAKNNKRNIL